MFNLKIKRIYDEPSNDDGVRILVDRLWPRGITKEKAHLNYWFKDIAPSSELRKWFNHEEGKYEEFSRHYTEELRNCGENIIKIKNLLKTQNVTLIYAAKSPIINHATVLKNYINSLK